MAYENGAYNARAHSLTMGARMRAWALALIALGAAFALALAVAVMAPASMAFADDEEADTPAAANTAETEVGDSDTSLTPSDSDGLKPQDDADADAKPSEESEPVIISVSIISRDGRVLTTFQIEKGKTITFVDGQGEVLVQYTAEDPSVVEPVAPVKSGYEFVGWSVKINDEGNAVVTPQYKEVTPTPSPSSTTDDVKTVRNTSGTVTTNSPKTGDLLSIAAPIAVAGVALIAIVVLLFARRRS